MSNNKAFKVKNGLELADYNKSISDTAVDIFVYDTRKDSDGGAWRKRTQHTSWYNETLNTATRGSRKEFPAVAVIVAESSQITIYDGDDPDLPMWMVFNSGTGSGASGTMLSYDPAMTSVFMLNGVLCAGINASNAGLTRINFVAEDAFRHRTTTTSYPLTGSGGLTIATRNSEYLYSATSTGSIVNGNINDVAMTVLPNAPIDAATGLPVPTIAVATNGGVSVIKDDGTVVDIYYGSYTASRFVSFTAKNYLVCNFDNVTTNGRFTKVYRTIPSTDQYSSGTPYNSTNGEDAEYTNDLTSSWRGDLKFSEGLPTNRQFDNFSFAHSKGLLILDENEEAPSKGMLADITSSFNTGWMNGNIKLATLSDTDATNVTGSELVTNGDFDTDTSGWTESGVTTSVSAGVVTVTNSGASNQKLQQAITTVVGQKYVLSGTGTNGTGGARVYVLGAWFGGTSSTTFTATSTTTYIDLLVFGADGTTASFDNISVRLAEEDRSVNNNGLQVFGTVTKSAVATGSDLVAYSGFSGSNYLEQPYNSDLDFGTGDFCYMGWFKTSSNGITMFERCASPRSGNGMTVYMDGTGKPLWYKIVSGTPTIVVTPTAAYNNNTWVHFSAIRQNGVVSLYFNGQKDGSASDSTDMTNSSAIFRLGANATGTSGWTGSLALWRISATAPSPEQILKIYNDEKHLFTEGAQATLYGSSDSVTALAFDDTTNLLHVGTSAGRSVFQGLRRVDNTTTAVTSAISASNGLVADE